MCKRIVSIIIMVITVAFTFVSVHGNSAFADASDSALTITKSNDEFLSGDNFGDWFLSVEDSALRGVGVIGEGFYIRLGNNINVYDLNGNFSYRLAFKAKSNGPIDVFCAGDELVFLLHRDNEMVTSDIEGSIVSSSELNDETAPVGNLDRRLFSVNKLKITATEKVLLVKLPPKITLPFFESSHLSVTLEGDSNIGAVTLFDDGGIVFFKEFVLVAYIIIITVVLGVIFICKTKKENSAFHLKKFRPENGKTYLRKTRLYPTFLYSQLDKWLKSMSQNGWHIVHCSTFFFWFEKGETKTKEYFTYGLSTQEGKYNLLLRHPSLEKLYGLRKDKSKINRNKAKSYQIVEIDQEKIDVENDVGYRELIDDRNRLYTRYLIRNISILSTIVSFLIALLVFF